MHVGFAPVFMNTTYELATDTLSDSEVYRRDLALADLAEPLGFDSIWEPEHHFTPYEMTPNVLQFLTYMAGRTKKIRLGSMVVVLPWHDPMRVAEEITLLDYFSGGRAILGIGRGLGALEFGGFGVDMNVSRELFVEHAEAIVEALKTGVMEYNGKHLKQARREIRPRPFKSFEGRLFGAGLSPETMPLLAKLGAGIMMFTLKGWKDVQDMQAAYKKTWAEARPGTIPPKIILDNFVYVHKDSGKAKDMAYKYIAGYLQITIKHYDMAGENFATKKGYEFYAEHARAFRDNTREKTEQILELIPWGTPDEYLDKLKKVDELIDLGALLTHFNYAGMPYDVAEENMRLFAREVLPELKKWDKGPFAEAKVTTAE
jgi:alkanesulfonate monooxygenase SsuD/methylene tetrahydromethanopterin reductase-like flavin-dependent oxidoreductase (luciferase family)